MRHNISRRMTDNSHYRNALVEAAASSRDSNLPERFRQTRQHSTGTRRDTESAGQSPDEQLLVSSFVADVLRQLAQEHPRPQPAGERTRPSTELPR